MTTGNTDSLGPLPQSKRNADLQALSFKAFEHALPATRFCFRDERTQDVGVDASIEVRIGPGHTNFRAQVQLKGTDSGAMNQDGSISLKVDTSNLNYLLNGPSPLYVLHVEPGKVLWYLWARDERQRLDRETSTWMTQGTVTLRFRRRLTSEALDEIHDRILREGQLHRRIHDTLARATTAEHVVVGIDKDILASTDPSQIEEWFLTGGMTVVAAGYAKEAIAAARYLNPDGADKPRVRVVMAYAHYTLGRFQAAIGHIAEAEVQGGLSPQDRHFLTTLRLACDYQTGRISMQQYLDLQHGTLDAGSAASLELRLDSLRHDLATERDAERRHELLRELRSTVDDITRLGDAAAPLSVHSRLILAQMEGAEGVFSFSEDIALAQMRSGMGLTPNVQQVRAAFRQDSERTSHWEQTVQQLIQEALKQKHPLLIGEAILLRATIRLMLVASRRITLIGLGRDPTEVPASAIHTLMQDAEHAMRIFTRAGNLEGELRAKMLLADSFDLAGQPSAAQSLAQDALAKAKAMSYVRIEAHAQTHISGRNTPSGFEAFIRQKAAEDEDYRLADSTDEDMHHWARSCLSAAELPSERFPVVERECLSLRDIARERVRWCRHIDLIQTKLHIPSADTMWRQEPERWCICTKHGFESGISSTDWQALISAFRQTRCHGCADRSRKVTSA